jgi:hypothetical protein
MQQVMASAEYQQQLQQLQQPGQQQQAQQQQAQQQQMYRGQAVGQPQQQPQQQQQAVQPQVVQYQQFPQVPQYQQAHMAVQPQYAQIQPAQQQQQQTVAAAQPLMFQVPPGMSTEQVVAQLQQRGVTGQIMQINAQGQLQPASYGVTPQYQAAPVMQQQYTVAQAAPPPPPPHQQAAGGRHQPQVTVNANRNQPAGRQNATAAPATAVTVQAVANPVNGAPSAEDLTKLNPKAQPFVPKVSKSQNGAPATGTAAPAPSGAVVASTAAPATAPATVAPAAPTVPRKEGAPITCPHCQETGFLTEYVLRSHIKAKHSAESQQPAAGAEASNKAITHLNGIIRTYLQQDLQSGSCAFDQLTKYLETNHATALGEAIQVAKTLNEVLVQGNFRRFAYSADELSRAEIRTEIAKAGEARVALPATDYMSKDSARSKALENKA